MIQEYLTQWIEEGPALIGSIIAVLFMVGVAALLGFRRTTRIDEAELQRLAAAESASLERHSIKRDGKSAIARLSGDKLMIARVMGADVSARVSPLALARFGFRDGKFSVAFADAGFPPLELAVDETPPWLARLGSGEAT
jgi:hypothetical protein